MAARDGDGWIECSCGSKHWGLNGAAGLLIFKGNEILLQHRAPWVHNGDTWGIPGGARDSHETLIEGAIREAIEETGIDPHELQLLATYIDDHGSWSYATIFAKATENLVAHEVNDESYEVRWIQLADVTRLPLHPSLARTWPSLLEILNNLITPR